MLILCNSCASVEWLGATLLVVTVTGGYRLFTSKLPIRSDQAYHSTNEVFSVIRNSTCCADEWRPVTAETRTWTRALQGSEKSPLPLDYWPSLEQFI